MAIPRPKAPMSVPKPGAASAVGQKPPKVGTGLPKLRIKPIAGVPGASNSPTRNYGKQEPPPSPNPFGNSNIGGM